MMWDHVIAAFTATFRTDQMLLDRFGTKMRMAGTGAFALPSLEWTLIADTETELWAPCVVQFDIWCSALDDVIAIERHLRGMFHSQYPITMSDTQFWGEYQDGSILAAPDRDGVVGRGIRFRFTPLRSRFALSSPST